MRRRRMLAAPLALGLALVALVAGELTAVARPETPWSRARAPSGGRSRAIGGTSNGCLAGAVAMPRSGKGFRVMRPARRRHFGHRTLVAVLRALGARVRKELDVDLALGDLSQPRGGPAPDGHASHQTGLDVDVWYAVGGRRGRPAPTPMVDPARLAPTAAWGATQVRMLELAAADARVDRIFVNPVLKRALCEAGDADRTWLAKLRPWWGHDEHFHIRLACPAGSPECVGQPAIPPGDGCAELDRWLSTDEDAQAEKAEARKAYRARIGARPAMPARCAALVR